MKRKPILKLNILIISAAVPLLIFSCAAISLVSYLAFYNLDAAESRPDSDSGPVRIRTIPELESGAPAQVTNESDPVSVIEIDDGLAETAAVVEVQPVVEVSVEPVISEPADDAEVPTGLSLEEEAEVILETTISAEPEAAAEATQPDPAADDEESAAAPQDEEAPAEELPVVELPVEPASSTRPLPEIAANPAPPQEEPPAPTEPPEPTFVPDSSFFDQLLEQVN